MKSMKSKRAIRRRVAAAVVAVASLAGVGSGVLAASVASGAAHPAPVYPVNWPD